MATQARTIDGSVLTVEVYSLADGDGALFRAAGPNDRITLELPTLADLLELTAQCQRAHVHALALRAIAQHRGAGGEPLCLTCGRPERLHRAVNQHRFTMPVSILSTRHPVGADR